VWWLVAAATGSFTHVLWDAFTHSSEGATWFDGLAGHQRVFLVLQLLSSVLGLATVLVWGWRWWWRTPPRLAVRETPRTRQRVSLAVFVLAAVAGGAVRWRYPTARVEGRASHSLQLGELVYGTLGGLLVAVVLLTAVHWARRRPRSAVGAEAG
jgi:hypothetical protein